jgi:hypothetical protein
MASYPTQSGAAETWVDIAAVDTDIASVAVTVQNVGNYLINVYEGGGSAPSAVNDGVALRPLQSMNVNSANVWVRSTYAGFGVAITDTK